MTNESILTLVFEFKEALEEKMWDFGYWEKKLCCSKYEKM